MFLQIFHNQEIPIVGLSPMAGYTDSAYRTICRQLGADFVVTELVSADGIIQNYISKKKIAKTFRLLRFNEAERPIFIQLFGADTGKMKQAAEIIANEFKPDGIDINMGCPAHKVVCEGYGSALMKDLSLAAKIVESVKAGSNLPVTVKTRLGWSDDKNLSDFVTNIENAGADAIAVHGRTFTQGFSGKANWGPIYEAKTKVKIPVLGNGDIWSAADALEKINNLDGILIGRAAVGNPWIFASIKDAFKTQTINQDQVNWSKRFSLLRQHINLKFKDDGEHGLIEMRKILPMHLKGLPNAAKYRQKINTIVQVNQIEDLINEIISENRDLF